MMKQEKNGKNESILSAKANICETPCMECSELWEREKVAKALHSFQREVYKHLKMMMQWQNEILMDSFDGDAKKCREEKLQQKCLNSENFIASCEV